MNSLNYVPVKVTARLHNFSGSIDGGTLVIGDIQESQRKKSTPTAFTGNATADLLDTILTPQVKQVYLTNFINFIGAHVSPSNIEHGAKEIINAIEIFNFKRVVLLGREAKEWFYHFVLPTVGVGRFEVFRFRSVQDIAFHETAFLQKHLHQIKNTIQGVKNVPDEISERNKRFDGIFKDFIPENILKEGVKSTTDMKEVFPGLRGDGKMPELLTDWRTGDLKGTFLSKDMTQEQFRKFVLGDFEHGTVADYWRKFRNNQQLALKAKLEKEAGENIVDKLAEKHGFTPTFGNLIVSDVLLAHIGWSRKDFERMKQYNPNEPVPDFIREAIDQTEKRLKDKEVLKGYEETLNKRNNGFRQIFDQFDEAMKDAQKTSADFKELQEDCANAAKQFIDLGKSNEMKKMDRLAFHLRSKGVPVDMLDKLLDKLYQMLHSPGKKG